MNNTNAIIICFSSANGPYVEYTADDDIAAVNAQLPLGYSADYSNQLVTEAGQYRSPLIGNLTTAYTAAYAAYAAAEQAWIDDDSCTAEDKTHPLFIAKEAADKAVAIARRAWFESDEPREYKFCMDGYWEPGHILEPSNVEADLTERLKDGDWDRSETLFLSAKALVIDPATDEAATDIDEITVDIILQPSVPECKSENATHAWRSPYSVLGGIKENPGVWGHGGGVIIREVCCHCGTYKVTDTWATNPKDGSQGHESISYEDPDEDSLA